MEEFYTFLNTYPVQRFKKGEVILQQYEQPLAAYVVKNGIVKTYNLTPSGEEKSIALNLKDEIFPLSWVFANTHQAEYFYEALTDCTLYVVPSGAFILFLKMNPKVQFKMLHLLVGHYSDNQMHINALEQSKAADKVLYTLYFLAHRFGKGIDLDMVEIQVPLTQQDMANFMGLARETTAIELKKLERENVIFYQSRNYVIQKAKLNQKLGEDSDYPYKLTSENAYAKTC